MNSDFPQPGALRVWRKLWGKVMLPWPGKGQCSRDVVCISLGFSSRTKTNLPVLQTFSLFVNDALLPAVLGIYLLPGLSSGMAELLSLVFGNHLSISNKARAG